MRFLVDECTGPVVAKWLRSLHYDVFSIYDEAQGLDDERIIEKKILIIIFWLPMIKILANLYSE